MNNLKTPLWIIAISTAAVAVIVVYVTLYAISRYLELRYALGSTIRCVQDWTYC